MATFTAGQILTAGVLTSALAPAVQIDQEDNVTTTSTTYVSLGADDMDFTMPYPASGSVMFIIMASMQGTVADTGEVFMSLEIHDTNAAGTQRLAANDRNGVRSDTEDREPYITGPFVVTGLPTSGTMFVRAKYRVNAGTGDYIFRRIIAVPQP